MLCTMKWGGEEELGWQGEPAWQRTKRTGWEGRQARGTLPHTWRPAQQNHSQIRARMWPDKLAVL